MKAVLIWGYCEDAILCGMCLRSCDEMRFLGSFDKNANARSKMVNPYDGDLDELKSERIDIIVTIKRIIGSINQTCVEWGITPQIMCFEDFWNSFLNYHPQAVSNGQSFGRWILSAQKFLKVPITNMFEIGSNYAQDSNFAKVCLNIDSKNVYCFEANRRIALDSQKLYPNYNIYNCAVSDYDGELVLKLVPKSEANSGLSSVLNYEYTKNWETECVECIRLETFMRMHDKISEIDFLKVDVEGLNYEVLDGLGHYIDKVKCIQIEGEFINFHEKHSFRDIAMFLFLHNFEMVDFAALTRQNDSLWIRRDLLNTVPIY